MNSKWRFTFISLFFTTVFFAQELIKNWEIPPYTIELYRVEQEQEYGGIDVQAIGKPQKPQKASYTTYYILKNGKPTTVSGYIRTSKDSCELNFIDLGPTRNLTGVLGQDVVLNLCTKKLKAVAIQKPAWLQIPIDSAFIKDLQTDSIQRVHPKMNEAIRIFTTHEYTVLNNKYIPSEWQAPYLPRYQISIYQGKAKHEILFYWDRFIIDNYIYSSGGNSGTRAADKHFWESNLKLIEQDVIRIN